MIARAGVSRRTFYEHFGNKEECLLAAYDAGVEAMLAAIDEAIGDARPPRSAGDRRRRDRARPRDARANPAFARTFLVEVLAAGWRALERRAAVHARFAEQLATVHRAARSGRGREPPPHVFRACVDAIYELVTDPLLRRGAESLPSLLDELVDVERALILDAAPR